MDALEQQRAPLAGPPRDTDEPELRAFAHRQTARKVAILAALLGVALSAGAIVTWAMITGFR